MREDGKHRSLHLCILIHIATSSRHTFVGLETYFLCYTLLTVYRFVNREFQHVLYFGMHEGTAEYRVSR